MILDSAERWTAGERSEPAASRLAKPKAEPEKAEQKNDRLGVPGNCGLHAVRGWVDPGHYAGYGAVVSNLCGAQT